MSLLTRFISRRTKFRKPLARNDLILDAYKRSDGGVQISLRPVSAVSRFYRIPLSTRPTLYISQRLAYMLDYNSFRDLGSDRISSLTISGRRTPIKRIFASSLSLSPDDHPAVARTAPENPETGEEAI